MDYTENDIKKVVGVQTFTKGKEYYRYRMVLDCRCELDNQTNIKLIGKTQGSYNNNYIQNIQFYKTPSAIRFHGTCSCPMVFNCKHVVAVALYYLYTPKVIDPLVEINRWIDTIKNDSQIAQEEPKKRPNEYFLTYRIFDPDKIQRYGHLQIYKSHLSKNGKIIKGSVCSLHNVLYSSNYHDILNPQEWGIIGMCQGLFNRWNNTITFSAEHGYKTLRALVDTKRCFYANSDTPLSWSDEKFSLQFQWDNTHVEYSQLKSNLNEFQEITATLPIVMIDTQHNFICDTDTSLPFKTIERLFQSPKIPKEQMIYIYETLGNMAPISAPLGYSVETLEVLPIPHITLQKESEGGGHRIYLRMEYGEFLLECANNIEVAYGTKNKSRIKIVRNKEIENHHIQTLHAFGFLHQTLNKKLYFLTASSQNPQDALQIWNDFLTQHVKNLQEEGWVVVIEDDFTLHFEMAESISAQSEEKNDWFSLSFDLTFGGISRPLVPLLASIITQYDYYDALPPTLNLEIEENRYVSINTAEMEPILKTIFELFDKRDDLGDIILGAYESHLIADLDEDVVWKGSRELLELSEKLKNFQSIEKRSLPKSLNATLRDYQQEGYDWLGFLHDFRFAGILADDMGLGKTIQALAHLSRLKEEGRLTLTSLIIMPTSLIANWRNETERFTPNLRVLILHGSQRSDLFEKINEYDLVLTTYPLITRDLEVLNKKQFEYVILDEAQKIKNPKTQMAQAIKTLQANHRLALSGTPIENHIGELWSIFSFLMPGFLGHYSFFKEAYQNPIEKEHDIQTQERLNRRIKPFILRRTKESVALELPPKTEIIKYTQFESKQAKLYETIRSTMEKKVREAIKSKGLGKSHITILDALLKLRQVCCDPSLLSIDEAKKVKESAKLELLMELIEELLEEGRKILLFSQFTSMLSIIEAKLKTKKIRYVKLTGQTQKREEVINAFTKGEAELFLISLKAGGVGLNLVEADTVIHYDPWWNPAVENQATDRAYRIGQNKTVFVYKLIVQNSIEQKILELQKKKELIQNTIYDGNQSDEKSLFKGEELLELLKK